MKEDKRELEIKLDFKERVWFLNLRSGAEGADVWSVSAEAGEWQIDPAPQC